MSEMLFSAGSAIWLGVLTSMSPCPLATNTAAVSFLGRRVDRPFMVLGGGIPHSLGRAAAYVALGALLIAGLFLLEVIRIRLPAWKRSGEGFQERLAAKGMWGAIPLGALFALSFCPVPAQCCSPARAIPVAASWPRGGLVQSTGVEWKHIRLEPS